MEIDDIEQNILHSFPVYLSRRLTNKVGRERVAVLMQVRTELIQNTAKPNLTTDELLETSRLVEWLDYAVKVQFAEEKYAA